MWYAQQSVILGLAPSMPAAWTLGPAYHFLNGASRLKTIYRLDRWKAKCSTSIPFYYLRSGMVWSQQKRSVLLPLLRRIVDSLLNACKSYNCPCISHTRTCSTFGCVFNAQKRTLASSIWGFLLCEAATHQRRALRWKMVTRLQKEWATALILSFSTGKKGLELVAHMVSKQQQCPKTKQMHSPSGYLDVAVRKSNRQVIHNAQNKNILACRTMMETAMGVGAKMKMSNRILNQIGLLNNHACIHNSQENVDQRDNLLMLTASLAAISEARRLAK
jgi:hypothetical protein